MVERGGDITGMWDTRKGPFSECPKLESKKPTKKCPKGTFKSASSMDRRLWGFSFMDNAGCYMLDTAGGGVSAQLMRMQKKGTSRGEKIAVKGPKCNEFYQATMGVIDGVLHMHTHAHTHTHMHTYHSPSCLHTLNPGLYESYRPGFNACKQEGLRLNRTVAPPSQVDEEVLRQLHRLHEHGKSYHVYL
jgi:hypothetical protein